MTRAPCPSRFAVREFAANDDRGGLWERFCPVCRVTVGRPIPVDPDCPITLAEAVERLEMFNDGSSLARCAQEVCSC